MTLIELKLFVQQTDLWFRKEKKTIKLDPTRSFNAPFVGFAFKIEVKIENRWNFNSNSFLKAGGRNTGATQLTYVRVYQGGVKRGDTLYNIRTNKRARVTKLVRMHSNKAEVRTKTKCLRQNRLRKMFFDRKLKKLMPVIFVLFMVSIVPLVIHSSTIKLIRSVWSVSKLKRKLWPRGYVFFVV